MLNIVLFSYSQIVSTCLLFLNCIDVPGYGRYMYTFPAISCDSSRYSILYVPVAVLLVLNTLGTPLVIFYRLHRQKEKLETKGESSIAILFKPYEIHSYYWTCYILIRRVIIACISTFLLTKGALRAFMSIIFNVICLVLQMWKQPYVHDIDDKLETTSLVILIIISSVQAYSPPPTNDVPSKILALMLVVCYGFGFGVYLILDLMKDLREGKLQRMTEENTIEMKSI